MTVRAHAVLALVLAGVTTVAPAQDTTSRRPVIVASKPFAESYLLAELFAQLLEANGIPVERRPGLGATEVAFAALRSGAIDVYPEYTGTGLLAILHRSVHDPAAAFDAVSREFSARWDVHWLPPLGFENTYAIAMRRADAERLAVRTLGDLARVAPRLTAGFTPDFIGRADGLPGLARVYGIRFAAVRPLNQALKYRALEAGKVDVVDGYSTDGEIARDDLVVLDDDRRFFPPYEACALAGPRLWRDVPRAAAVLGELSGRLDVATMRVLNERVERGEAVTRVAADALRAMGLVGGTATAARAPSGESFGAYLWQHRAMLLRDTRRHVLLVALPLLVAVLVAVPLGLWLERVRTAAEPVIRSVGVVQTIPSIALLAIMIPLFGVGVWPALVALWLYSLYPIVRATFTAVRDADPAAVSAAHALGMTRAQILWYVRAPLAAPGILGGIRTAAVIGVGTATLAAFIGAGGLGEPIATGLALDDSRLILSGAIPAAVLAVVVDGLLAVVERMTMPGSLRRSPGASREPLAASRE